tara:strand:+ start:516 stop:698 length:183 start_codon:yes stop_codon:yes gene_type:complete
MNTNDMFAALVRDMPLLTTESFRKHYTELTKQVNAEGNDMTPEAMCAAILHAHNTPQPAI